MIDQAATNRSLAVELTSVMVGVERTVRWLNDHKLY
jgi:hypothetical protein